MKSASRIDPKERASRSNGVGARDDSSVLFSLSALVAKGNTELESAPSRVEGQDDGSGLIDIKALAAAAKERSPVEQATPVATHLDIFPFEVPPAPIEVTPNAQEVLVPPAKKTSQRVLLAVSAGLLVMAAGAGFLVISARKGPVPIARESLGAIARAAEQGLAAAREKPADSANSPAPTAAPQSPIPPRQQGSAKIPGPGPRPTSVATDPTVTKAPDKRPPVDTCGGDLMCAMQRAAGKR